MCLSESRMPCFELEKDVNSGDSGNCQAELFSVSAPLRGCRAPGKEQLLTILFPEP